ncbi:MAG: hypothetical protein ACTSV5_10240 [Promethearchaeota archaeon]
MQRDILNLPFFLLLSFIIYCGFFKTPAIADGLIAIALSGLYGWQLFLNFKTPNIIPSVDSDEIKEKKEELKQLAHDRELLKARVEIKRLATGLERSGDNREPLIQF